MTEAPKLSVLPNPAKERCERAIEILREILADAEKGDVDALIIICRRPDEKWVTRRTGFESMSEVIGKLEITKHEAITEYLVGEDK